MAGKRGMRVNKIRHDENTRLKIRVSQIINHLQKHVFGKVEMQPSAVSAALGLLRKVMPDLSQSEARVTHVSARELPDDELASIATGGSQGVALPSIDPQKLN